VKQDLDNTWVEPVLAKHLRRVEAPAELWMGVEKRERPARPSRPNWQIALVAITAMVIAGMGTILNARRTSHLSLESASGSEIQAWVKATTGLDVPLPNRVGQPVRLAGARLTGKAVEVSYFVRNRPERLFIARADVHAPLEHRLVERSSKRVSWTMGGLFYAVDCAAAEDAQVACMLCHS